MKRISVIIVTGILAVILTIIQINLIKNATKKEEYAIAYVYTCSMEAHNEMSEDMLKAVNVPLSLLPTGYGAQKEDLEGYLTRDVYEGEIALTNDVTSESPDNTSLLQKTQEDHVFISLKPDPDKVVAWQVKPESRVDVLFIPRQNDETKSFRLKDKRVAGITDENFTMTNLSDSSDSKDKPLYLILEVTLEEAELIASARQFGSFEMILKE